MSNSAAARPGPRPSSSREEIVECALRMMDREGPDALTFRAVARELGITVGALSRYFKNLADLEDEVTARILSELNLPKSGKSLRQELLRFSLQTLESHRAHPYLLKVNGPASAAVLARMTRQWLRVLTDAGIDFNRAMAIYSLIGNLPYAWAVQATRPHDPEMDAVIARTYTEELGEFAPQMAKLLDGTARTSEPATDLYRRWLLIYIDALLAEPPAAKAR